MQFFTPHNDAPPTINKSFEVVEGQQLPPSRTADGMNDSSHSHSESSLLPDWATPSFPYADASFWTRLSSIQGGRVPTPNKDRS